MALVALAAPMIAACDGPIDSTAVGSVPGRIAWSLSTLRAPSRTGALAADSEHVYAYVTSLRIDAVRIIDRSVSWSASADETLDNGFSPRGIARCGDLVIFGSYLKAYAVSPRDGSRAWSWQPSAGGALGYGAPVCDGRTVYFGTGAPMLVYAVDVATGNERWHASVARSSSTGGFATTPQVGDGVVVACTRDDVTPATGMIVGIDAASGAIKWRYVWDPLSPATESSCAVSVAVASGIAVGAADDGRIFGIDVQTGSLRWSAPKAPNWDYPRDERPVWIDAGIAVAGSGSGTVTGYDLITGVERWSSRDAGGFATVIIGPMVGNRGLFVGVNSSGGAVAFDALTGARRWTLPAGSGLNQQKLFGPGVLTERLFIAVGSDGLYAVNR